MIREDLRVLFYSQDTSLKEKLSYLLGSVPELQIFFQTLEEEVLHVIQKEKIDLILIDINLDQKGQERISLLKKLKSESFRIPILFLIPEDHEGFEVESFKLGAQGCVTKSKMTGPGLRRAIRTAMEHYNLILNLEEERKRLTDLIQEVQKGNIKKGYSPTLYTPPRLIDSRLLQENENRLKRLTEESQYKSLFLTTISHEIRTPLNVIIGIIELILENPRSEDMINYIQTLHRSAKMLLVQINDILDLSKIEANKIVLNISSFNLDEALQTVRELFEKRAETKHLTFHIHKEEGIPLLWRGDAERINQVLSNLIYNALKFTSSGSIEIIVKQEEGALCFTVKDTGIGIAEKDLPLVFEGFYQSASPNKNQSQGTGLGLTISKQLVELMGGKISAKSVEGKGSVFSFMLPLAVVEGPQEVKVSEDKKTLLIVEDEKDIDRLLRAILEPLHLRILSASNGREALEIVKKEKIDALLTDIKMPEMGGLEFIQEVQKFNLHIPFILLSGHMGDEVHDALKIGNVQFFRKPLTDENKFKQAIKETVERGFRERQLQEMNKRVGQQEAPHILLADDSPDNRFLIAAYLKHTSCHLEIAEDGLEALEKFKHQPFHIVFMDLNMPKMDGYDATAQMRQWESKMGKPATPIVALSASVTKEEVERCFRSGCTFHLPKPVAKKKFLETLFELTRQGAQPTCLEATSVAVAAGNKMRNFEP